MYKDIHTIKNILVLFAVLAIITFVVNLFIMIICLAFADKDSA